MIIEGDNPVHVIRIMNSMFLSKSGHEESWPNLPGPSGKAKYSWETDSEPVLWRKGEKNLEQRSEKDPETIRLQAVEAAECCNGVPFA